MVTEGSVTEKTLLLINKIGKVTTKTVYIILHNGKIPGKPVSVQEKIFFIYFLKRTSVTQILP